MAKPNDTIEKERELLAAVRDDPRDQATRQVYADWLEENGFDLRAEMLRADHDTEAGDAGWRAVVARAPIAKCVTFEVQCPKQWDALAPVGGDDQRRFCGACHQDVHYVTSVEEARRRGRDRQCIAIDAALATGAAVAAYESGSRPMMMGKPAYFPPDDLIISANPPAPQQPGVMARIKGWFRK